MSKITDKATPVLNYTGYNFNREYRKLFRNAFGANHPVLPKNGFYHLKKHGTTHRLSENQLMTATEYCLSQSERSAEIKARREAVTPVVVEKKHVSTGERCPRGQSTFVGTRLCVELCGFRDSCEHIKGGK